MTSVKAWPLLLLQFSLVSMEKGCKPPALNGKFILSLESKHRNNFPDNSNAFVECPKGHERGEGSNVIICTNGNWSDPELKCQKIDCGSPEDSPHMTYSITDGTLFGASIKPMCDIGYDLEGSSYRHCLVSGWSGRVKCTLIICDEPDPIEHGKFSKPRDNIQFGDVVEYSCDDNYTLIGDRSITCGQYGEYSSPPPQCKVTVTPTTASTTTNKATTTATATDTTTATDITTFTASATSLSNERSEEELLKGRSSLYFFFLIIGVLTVSICIICFICIICIVYCYNKQRGSYNTGEGLRTKEELMLYQSL